MKKLLAVLLVVTFVSVNLFAQAQPTVKTDSTKKEAVKSAHKKVAADKKVAVDKVTADKKVAADKVTADKKVARGKKVKSVNTNHAVIKKADAVKKPYVNKTGPAKKEDSVH